MTSSSVDRETVRRVREHLEEWTFDARDRAYAEFFEGPTPVVSDDELRLLDRIDSDLTRQGGEGLWGADEYGVVAGSVFEAGAPRVVCTYHPVIPSEGFRGDGSLDEATREKLNDVLWDFCERVVNFVQEDLDAFVRTSTRE